MRAIPKIGMYQKVLIKMKPFGMTALMEIHIKYKIV